MARERKQFDENSGLGPMRLFQAYNILVLLFFVMVMLFVKGPTVVLDFGVLANVALLLSQAAVIYLIGQRKMYTRQIVVGVELFEYGLITATDISAGTFEPISAAFQAIPYIIIILYFLRSRRAKAVLVQPWSSQTILQEQETQDRKLWDPKSRAFWMRLLIYFFAFSIMGHWMEMGVQILVINGLFPGTVASPDSLTWRDNLNPFFIYGIAVAFCGLVLYPAFLALRSKFPQRWKAYLFSFLLNTVFCVAAELILGLFFNADYHAWDYRDQFMNFMGQVCLVYTVAFGIAASLITWFVYPMLERSFSLMNRDIFRVVFVVSCVLFIVIFATYNVDPPDFLAIDFSSQSIAQESSSSSAG